MRPRRLSRVQWRLTLAAVWTSLLSAALVLSAVWIHYRLDILLLFSYDRVGVPLIVLILVLAVTVGVALGYTYGNRLKQRLEQLAESAMRFARGDFAQRVPPLGRDEIGTAAEQLNVMAQRIEKQIASLQKLATENAEWRDQMKQSVIFAERQRLARELHDAVSQQLFAISMMAAAVREQMGDDHPLCRQVEMIEQMAGLAQNEMRALLMHLRPATLMGKGLKKGLEDLLQELKGKHPVEIRWDFSELTPLPKGIEDHLFRIVQEALSNVFRHSRANAVSVRLAVVNHQAHLKIIDNGVGFDMHRPKTSTYGLKSIQERASEVGGIAEIVSFPGKGTQIEVKIPIVDERGEAE